MLRALTQVLFHQPMSVMLVKCQRLLTTMAKPFFKGRPPKNLPVMTDFEVHSRRVTRVLALNPGPFTLQGTNTYIVGTGQQRTLIDTGEGKPQYKRALERACGELGCEISQVLITHRHFDHVGGIPDVKELFPAAVVRRYPNIEDVNVDDETTLRVLYTPGHCDDHCCFVLDEEHALFSGDNVLGHGTSWFDDLGSYMASLATMLQVARDGHFTTLYPAHGPISNDPVGLIAYYLDHRIHREAQVLTCLQDNNNNNGDIPSSSPRWWWFFASATPGVLAVSLTSLQIVRRIYGPTLPTFLIPAAQSNVLAHLDKLLSTGAVTKIYPDLWIAPPR